MHEENIAIKKMAEERLTSFLKQAKKEGLLDDALSYLVSISLAENDNTLDFNNKKVGEYLKDSARSYGIINHDGSVIPNMQKDLIGFLLDKNNKFIADTKDNIDSAKIKKSFERSSNYLHDILEKQGETYHSLSLPDATNRIFKDSITQFLKYANVDGKFADAISYLGFIAAAGNDKLYPPSDGAGYSRAKSRYLGIVNEKSNVSALGQKDINDFIADSGNHPDAFVVQNTEALKAAREQAITQHTKAIHQCASDFINDHKFNGNKARVYLATLAISDNFKNDIAKVIKDPDMVERFNDDVSNRGITAGVGLLSPNTKNALASFFSPESKLASKAELPALKATLTFVKGEISEGRQQRDGRGF